MKLSWPILGGVIAVSAVGVIAVLGAVVIFGGGDDGGEVTPDSSPSPVAEEGDAEGDGEVSGDDHDGRTGHDDGHIVGGSHDGATAHDDGHIVGAGHDGATAHDDGHIVGGDHDGATAHDDRHERGEGHDGRRAHDDRHDVFAGDGHDGPYAHDDTHDKGDGHDGDTGHDDSHVAGGGHDGATAHDDGDIVGADHDGATGHDDGHIVGGDHDGATEHDDDHRLSPEAAATAEVTTERTPTTQQAVDAALASALEHFDAVSDADCETNNPQKKNCVDLRSQPSTAQGGIAVFGVGAPDGPGFVGVLGRDSSGEWHFWRGGQQDHQLLILPGDALVCGYGDRLNVRSSPTTDAAVVGAVEDITTVRAEEFLLTEEGSDLQQGYGWFRLSSPLDGWAYSKYLTNAGLGDCTLHDAQEPGP